MNYEVILSYIASEAPSHRLETLESRCLCLGGVISMHESWSIDVDTTSIPFPFPEFPRIEDECGLLNDRAMDSQQYYIYINLTHLTTSNLRSNYIIFGWSGQAGPMQSIYDDVCVHPCMRGAQVRSNVTIQWSIYILNCPQVTWITYPWTRWDDGHWFVDLVSFFDNSIPFACSTWGLTAWGVFPEFSVWLDLELELSTAPLVALPDSPQPMQCPVRPNILAGCMRLAWCMDRGSCCGMEWTHKK